MASGTAAYLASSLATKVARHIDAGVEQQVQYGDRMFKLTVGLGIFRIARVVHPFRRYSSRTERSLIEIGLSRWTAEIAVGARRSRDAQKSLHPGALLGISRISDNPGVKANQLDDFRQKDGIYVRQARLLIGRLVPALDGRRALSKERVIRVCRL